MKWTKLLLTCTIFTFSFQCFAEITQSTHQESTQEKNTLSDIQQLRAEGNNVKARAIAMDYLKNYPKDFDVQYLLALTYLDENNKAEAYKLLSYIINAYPRYTDARISLINLNLQLENSEKKNLKAKNNYHLNALKLVNEGLQLEPNNQELKAIQDKLITKTKPIEKPMPKKEEIKKFKITAPSPIKQIRSLMQSDRLEHAKKLSLSYLKDNPNDLDIKLFLGLIYLRKNNYEDAEATLSYVLEKSPKYMDARVALIRAKLKLSEQEHKQAIFLFREGLTQDRSYKDLTNLRGLFSWYDLNSYEYTDLFERARQLVAAEKLKEAKQTYTILFKNNPNDLDVLLALANVDYELGYDRTALNLLREGLAKDPNNIDLLLKKAEVEATTRQYALSYTDYRKVLTIDPEKKEAKDAYQALLESSPRYSYGLNEIGFFTDNAWVQDLHETWDYSTLFYARDTSTGRLVLKTNYASRQNVKGFQYEVDYSPRFNRNVYLDFAASVAKKPQIFPDYMLAAELYWNFPSYVELSGGTKRSQIESTYFSTQTVSITRYQGQNMFTLRPYHFIPKGNKNISNLFTGTARHYFTTDDHYISMTVGTGKSPDLADLLTVDFLVITNNFITLSYEAPIMNHRLTFDVGVGYQRWGYPSGLVRNLYDGSIGLKCRF